LPLVVKTCFYCGKNHPGKNRFSPTFRQKLKKISQTWQKPPKHGKNLSRLAETI
jgi:hypothetical protein